MILKKESVIKLNNKAKLLIPLFTYDEARKHLGKGWNYINIYDLIKFKQAYLALARHDKNQGKKGFFEEFRKLSGWITDNRSMDEFLNAFKCFNIIENNSDRLDIIKSLDFKIETLDELEPSDKETIGQYYFSYIRFKYFHNWFLGNIQDKKNIFEATKKDVIEQSIPIFSFSDNLYYDNEKNFIKKKKPRKLIDTFFYFPPLEYHQFNSKEEIESKEEKALMRFWDVYIEWGKKLSLIEKVNITQALGIHAYTNESRSLYLNYFINDMNEINLQEFVKKFYPKNLSSISLPELTVNLALYYRCSIKKIHDEIIRQSLNSNHQYSLQKTSAIFINGKEFIYPKIGNAFVSHIYIR